MDHKPMYVSLFILLALNLLSVLTVTLIPSDLWLFLLVSTSCFHILYYQLKFNSLTTFMIICQYIKFSCSPVFCHTRLAKYQLWICPAASFSQIYAQAAEKRNNKCKLSPPWHGLHFLNYHSPTLLSDYIKSLHLASDLKLHPSFSTHDHTRAFTEKWEAMRFGTPSVKVHSHPSLIPILLLEFVPPLVSSETSH